MKISNIAKRQFYKRLSFVYCLRLKNEVFETDVHMKFPTQFGPLYKPSEFVHVFLKHTVY
jgi:hypothetical protein